MNMDVKATPLQIKTDSTLGSGDLVFVRFFNKGASPAGGVKLHFTSPMQYELEWCTEERLLLENVPAQQDKVWTISRTSDNRIKIECNGVVAADFEIASCTHSAKNLYERNMEKIRFFGDDEESDTASDFYRPKGYDHFNYPL